MGFLKFPFSNFLATLPSLYHSANMKDTLPIGNPTAKMIVANIFIHLENNLIVALCLTVEPPDAIHMDELKPIAIWCHTGGTIESLFSILFKRCRKDIMSLLKFEIHAVNVSIVYC